MGVERTGCSPGYIGDGEGGNYVYPCQRRVFAFAYPLERFAPSPGSFWLHGARLAYVYSPLGCVSTASGAIKEGSLYREGHCDPEPVSIRLCLDRPAV